MADTERVSTMRLYGAAIGIISGVYSVFVSVTGVSMTTGSWFMLVLGGVVLVHGVVLLTPVAGRIGTASGPLMLVYAGLMLLNQLRLAAGGTGGLDSGMGGSVMNGGMGTMMDSTTGTVAMGADPGMVAIAVLMLASGLIMTVRRDMMSMVA